MRILYFLFFLSGALGLIYESAWLSLIQKMTGSSLAAVSITVSAFMTGLALGARAGGRLSKKGWNHVRTYGLLELALPPALGLAALLFWLAPVGTGPGNLVIAFLVTLPVPLVMGATLPVFIQGMARDSGLAGSLAGRIYFINTLGASLGAFIAGFVLLESLGIQKTFFTASVFNVLIGVAALLISRKLPVAQTREKTETPPGPAPGTGLFVLYLLFGFVSMGCEMAWIRILETRFISTAFSFAVILTVFLAGIAFGSFLFKARFDNKGRAYHLRLFLGLLFVYALAVGLSSAVILKFPLLFPLRDFSGLVLSEMAVALAAMALPTLVAGFLFPLMLRLAFPGASDVGERAGALYAWNTFGTVAGGLAVPFVLFQCLGVQASLGLLTLVSAAVLPVMAMAFLGRDERTRVVFLAVFVVPLILAVPLFKQRPLVLKKAPEKILTWYREGPMATVAVVSYKHVPYRNLEINGVRTEGGTNPEALVSQRQQVGLPMALVPGSKEVLVLGLGTGISMGPLKDMGGVRKIDCVEISEEIIEASAHFKTENRDILADPRVTLFRDDARHFAAATKNKYDLVVGDLFFPWLKGSGPLYARDHFENVSKILKPGGLFCQWLPLYQLSPRNLRIVVNTFAAVFPKGEIRIGHMNPEKTTLALLSRAFPDSAPGRRAGALKFDPNVPVSTDDRPLTEFLAARDFFLETEFPAVNNAWVSARYRKNRAADPVVSGLLEVSRLYLGGSISGAVEALSALSDKSDSVPGAEFILPQLANDVHKSNAIQLMPAMVRLLNRVTARTRNDFRLFAFLGKFQLLLQDYPAAVRACGQSVALNPLDENAYMNLGVGYAMTGRDSLARQAWQKVLALNPGNAEASYNIQMNLLKAGGRAAP